MNWNKKIGWTVCLLLLVASQQVSAQHAFKQRGNRGGILSLGVRTTFSLFGDGTGDVGTGVGGQFRLQVIDRVNTDWFSDYITTDIKGVASRTDYHIGWAVLAYPWLSKRKDRFEPVLPYIAAGNCFDFTRVVENRNRNNAAERLSTAIHVGIGAHFNITQHFDLTLNILYMIHIGKDVHADVTNGLVVIERENAASIEGHLLPTLSMSYKLGDLWGKRDRTPAPQD